MVSMVVPISASRSMPVSCSARPLVASIMKSTMAPLRVEHAAHDEERVQAGFRAAAKVSWARRMRRWVRVSCHDQTHTSVTISTSSTLAPRGHPQVVAAVPGRMAPSARRGRARPSPTAGSRAGAARWCSAATPSHGLAAGSTGPSTGASLACWPQLTLSPLRMRAEHAVGAEHAQHAVLALARALVAAGEIGRVGFDDGDAGEAAVGVVDAAGEMQVPLGIGGVAQRLADEGRIGVAVAVELEVAAGRRRRSGGAGGLLATIMPLRSAMLTTNTRPEGSRPFWLRFGQRGGRRLSVRPRT